MGVREDLAAIGAVVAMLEGWAAWQRGYRLKLGYPTKSAGLETGGSSTSFDDLCERADSAQMGIVDACVQDLVPVQRAAVMRRYGVAAVFRFPRDNYESVLCDAHVALIGAFRKKGVVSC